MIKFPVKRPVKQAYPGIPSLLNAVARFNSDGIITSGGAVTKWLNTANRNQVAYFDGVNDTLSTPDSASLELTGATQTWEWIGLGAVDWTPGAVMAIGSQYDTVANRSWLFQSSIMTGNLNFLTSSDGTSFTNAQLGIPSFTDGLRNAYDIKVERVASTGLLTCYTRPTGGTYSVLGTAVGVVGTLNNSTAELKLAAHTTASSPYNGTIKRFTLHDDDRLAAYWSADDYTDYTATTMTSGGVTWTLNSGAIIRDPYDMDVVLGTGGLTVTTLGGRNAVQASGVGGIETTVAPANIPVPMTMFMVGKADLLNGGVFTAARNDTSAGPFVQASIGTFNFNAGTGITRTSDTSLHLHTVRHNGDATTSYQIDSDTPVVGNAGTEEYNFGTFFADISAGSNLTGSMGEFILVPGKFHNLEIKQTQQQIMKEFGL